MAVGLCSPEPVVRQTHHERQESTTVLHSS